MSMTRKGGSSPHIEPDNLRSGQTLSIIDALCEGEIYGLSTGDLKSVYINKTRVMNDDGSYNINGVEFELLSGTQSQAPLSEVPAVEKEINVGVDIDKKGGGHTVTITDQNVDRARVTVGVRALVEGDQDGNRRSKAVVMQILVNGVLAHTVNIHGKTMTPYLRSYAVDLPQKRPAQIKVVRLTDDNNSDFIQDETFFSSYTEIIDSKLRYPNTAVVGISLDSETVSGNPTRNYLIKGLLINVPSNYNPITRAYSGFWDGSFKKAWSNNPAWVLYDLLTNARYGIGERLGGGRVDKIKLYEIGQYCDQVVPTGYGEGDFEPRMILNCNITEQRQAYEVINDICSVFRGMPVWDGLQMSASVDTPSDPECLYTNSNVVGGKFNYQSSALKARHTAVEVDYIHAADGTYSKKTEFVQDDSAVSRIGYNLKKIQAFGCTSRGQAVRAGRFILETERLERQTVTFSTGREGLRHNVGDIIEIADNTYSGVKIGGRIKALSSDKKTVTLDKDIDKNTGGTFSLLDVNGDIARVEIFANPTPNTIVFEYPLQTAKIGMVWTIAASGKVKPRPFRCLSIAENEDGTYNIEALEHEPKKNEAIDSGYTFEPEPDTAFGGKLTAITDLHVDTSAQNLGESGWQLIATWRTPTMFSNVSFLCEIKTVSGELVSRAKVKEMQLTHGQIAIGAYILSVQAVTDLGQLGEKTAISFEIDKPKLPSSVSVSSDEQAITLRVAISGNTVGTMAECYYSSNASHMSDPERLAKRFEALGNLFVDWVGYPSTDLGYSSRYYAIRCKNALGVSDWYFTGEVRTKTFDQGIGNLIGQQFPNFDWVDKIKDLSDQAYLAVQTQDGSKGGVFVDGSTGDNIALNFVADQVGFTNPDNYNDPLLYFDTQSRLLTLKGGLILEDGKTVSTADDIKGEKGDKGDTGAAGQNGTNGSDGDSVTSVINYYLASASSSGVTTSTSGWTTTAQNPTASKKYLWNYERINYASGKFANTPPTIIGNFAADGANGINGSNGKGIKSIAEFYKVHNSGTAAPSGAWSNTPQATTITNKYLWNYEEITYTDNTKHVTDKRVIGTHGDTGSTGATGNGVTNVVNYYLATNAASGITTSSSGWTTTAQNPTASKKYLWNYERIVYSNNDQTVTDPTIIGNFSADGSNGTNGSDGKGIKSIAEYYQVSSNGTTAPTGTWLTTPPQTTTTNKYLWNYEEITYTDNTKQVTDKRVIGTHGDAGANGANGENGSNGVSEMLFTGFEDGEAVFSETGTHVTFSTAEKWSGLKSSLIASYTGNIHLPLPKNLVAKFLGQRIEISFYAKLAENNTSLSHEIQTVWNTDINSAWKRHTLTKSWAKYTHTIDTATGTQDNARIAVHCAANNKGFLIDALSVYLKPKDGANGANGANGTNGTNGVNGHNGAGFYRRQVSAISWTNPTVLNAFKAASGRDPVPDDVFTQHLANGTSDTRRYANDTQLWISATLLIHGDMISTGTIAGNRITAGTEITAPKLKGGVIEGGTITGGAINGGYFSGGYAGFGETASGGYLVHSTGKRYNTLITVDGTVYTNRLSADSGTFKGTVQASQVIGAKVLIKSGSSAVTSGRTGDFNMYVNTGYIPSSSDLLNVVHVVECEMIGGITSPSVGGSAAYTYGAFGVGTGVLSSAIGNSASKALWGAVNVMLLNCESTPTTMINWKLYKIL